MRGEFCVLDDLLDPPADGQVVGRVVQLPVRHGAKLDGLEEITVIQLNVTLIMEHCLRLRDSCQNVPNSHISSHSRGFIFPATFERSLLFSKLNVKQVNLRVIERPGKTPHSILFRTEPPFTRQCVNW